MSGGSGEHFVSLSEPPATPLRLISLHEIASSSTVRATALSRTPLAGLSCGAILYCDLSPRAARALISHAKARVPLRVDSQSARVNRLRLLLKGTFKYAYLLLKRGEWLCCIIPFETDTVSDTDTEPSFDFSIPVIWHIHLNHTVTS